MQNNINKATFFELKARDNLFKIAEDSGLSVLDGMKNRPKFLERGKLKGVLAHNFLVGLNQYAAALRYLEASGASTAAINSPLDPDSIFSFNKIFAKRFVPELELFTGLLSASTLSIVNPKDVDGLKSALEPIILFDTAKTKPEGIVMGIIDAKNSKFTGLDIYSKINITTLGNLVPEFKAWLISNGWSDVDFE